MLRFRVENSKRPKSRARPGCLIQFSGGVACVPVDRHLPRRAIRGGVPVSVIGGWETVGCILRAIGQEHQKSLPYQVGRPIVRLILLLPAGLLSSRTPNDPSRDRNKYEYDVGNLANSHLAVPFDCSTSRSASAPFGATGSHGTWNHEDCQLFHLTSGRDSWRGLGAADSVSTIGIRIVNPGRYRIGHYASPQVDLP